MSTDEGLDVLDGLAECKAMTKKVSLMIEDVLTNYFYTKGRNDAEEIAWLRLAKVPAAARAEIAFDYLEKLDSELFKLEKIIEKARKK